LRGAAGNIGARKVQAAAADLERACASRETRSVIDAALAAVVAALAPVLTGLARLDSGSPDASGDLDKLDRPALQALIERLQVQLDGIDARAADTVRELVALTEGTRLAAAVGVVANAIAEFRFEAASAALKHVRWDP
jgi:HPt (histidine-containing phosphotransfer) domain-containing protein